MGHTTNLSVLYDEEVEQAGRVLSLNEFVDCIKARGDIFRNDSNVLTGRIEGVCLVSALLTGSMLNMVKVDIAKDLGSDFIAPGMESTQVVVVPEVIEPPRPQTRIVPQSTDRKTIRESRVSRGDNRPSGRAAGSPAERVAKTGIFAMMSQSKIKGIDAAFGDIAGKGGFAETIDAVISGVGGLKQGSSSGSGRRGASTIGFGKGYGTYGDGDGSGGIDDISALIGSYQTVDIGFKERHGKLKLPITEGSGILSAGGRSRNSIMAVVFQNLSVLRYMYNHRLLSNPGLKGKITVKFAIDEFGNVLHCEVVESSIKDAELEQKVVAKIRAWRFDKIDKPGDVTEIVYPFVFAAG
jgi:TonB family protein